MPKEENKLSQKAVTQVKDILLVLGINCKNVIPADAQIILVFSTQVKAALALRRLSELYIKGVKCEPSCDGYDIKLKKKYIKEFIGKLENKLKKKTSSLTMGLLVVLSIVAAIALLVGIALLAGITLITTVIGAAFGLPLLIAGGGLLGLSLETTFGGRWRYKGAYMIRAYKRAQEAPAIKKNISGLIKDSALYIGLFGVAVLGLGIALSLTGIGAVLGIPLLAIYGMVLAGSGALGLTLGTIILNIRDHKTLRLLSATNPASRASPASLLVAEAPPATLSPELQVTDAALESPPPQTSRPPSPQGTSAINKALDQASSEAKQSELRTVAEGIVSPLLQRISGRREEVGHGEAVAPDAIGTPVPV